MTLFRSLFVLALFNVISSHALLELSMHATRRCQYSVATACYRDSDGKVYASFPTDKAYIGRNRRAVLAAATAFVGGAIFSGGAKPDAARAADQLIVYDEDTAAARAAAETGERARQRERIAERRALLRVSATTSSRQSYLDLSRQRAELYNTTARAADCSAFDGSVFPKLPCW